MEGDVVIGVVGEQCTRSGNYICGNCGAYRYFDVGDVFDYCWVCGEEDIEWELEV